MSPTAAEKNRTLKVAPQPCRWNPRIVTPSLVGSAIRPMRTLARESPNTYPKARGTALTTTVALFGAKPMTQMPMRVTGPKMRNPMKNRAA